MRGVLCAGAEDTVSGQVSSADYLQYGCGEGKDTASGNSDFY